MIAIFDVVGAAGIEPADPATCPPTFYQLGIAGIGPAAFAM